MWVAIYIVGWIIVGHGIRKAYELDDAIDAALAHKEKRLFAESYASAVPVSRPFPFSQIGGAWSCSVVVTDDSVWVWPMRPFRPTFIAWLWGVERHWARADVRVLGIAKPEESLFGRRAVTITGKTRRHKTVVLKVYVHAADELASAIRVEAVKTHDSYNSEMV